MGFYEQISKYYDYIFPAGDRQLEYIRNAAGEPPKRLLDVACGSGGYSVALAKAGYSVTAVDLDEKMVELAKAKTLKEGLGIKVLACNMLDIGKQFRGASFDLVFCIGNSIVHLGSKKDILGALSQMLSVLKPGGTLVLQIINYDRIMKYHVSGLPAIVDKDIGLEFTRNYIYDKNKGIINFNTLLTVDGAGGRETYENSIELFPLLSGDMAELMKKAGFSGVEMYGDFVGSPYNDESYMLVVKGSV